MRRFETFAVGIFTIEYLVRIMSCPRVRAFFFAPLNLIDLLAIAPYYITLIIAMAAGLQPWSEGANAVASFTVLLRTLRLFRVFRIFKLGRYSAGMQVFMGALAHSATSLFLLLFLLVITVILFSSLMYLVEGEGDLSKQECDDKVAGECYFNTIPKTFWWAVVTITTVGYGDATPLTPLGRVVAGVTMICGIIVIALPISVLGNNFTKLMQQYARGPRKRMPIARPRPHWDPQLH